MSQTKRTAVLLVMVAASLVGDFVLPMILYYVVTPGTAMIGAVLIGCVGAQLGIVASWCALATQKAIVRVPMVLGLFSLGNFVLMLGIYQFQRRVELDAVLFYTMVAGVMAIGMLIPLWSIRLLLRRRIGLRSEQSAEQITGKFSIRFLLIATTVIAVMFGVIQAIAPSERVGGSVQMWLALILTVGLFSVFSAAVTIPSLWLVLGEQRDAIGWAAIGLFMAWFGGPIVIIVILAVFNLPVADTIGYIYAFGTGACGSMIGGLCVLRAMDYRLLHQRADGTLTLVADSPRLPNQPPPLDTGNDRE